MKQIKVNHTKVNLKLNLRFWKETEIIVKDTKRKVPPSSLVHGAFTEYQRLQVLCACAAVSVTDSLAWLFPRTAGHYSTIDIHRSQDNIPYQSGSGRARQQQPSVWLTRLLGRYLDACEKQTNRLREKVEELHFWLFLVIFVASYFCTLAILICCKNEQCRSF